MAVVTHQDDWLFPKPKEIKLDCSCPDYAGLSKHLAAVLYGVGARLDTRPELLFKLRGLDHNDLIFAVDPATVLGDAFGIKLETDPARMVSKSKPQPAPKAKESTAKAGVSAANWESKDDPLKFMATSLERLQTLARESAPDA